MGAYSDIYIVDATLDARTKKVAIKMYRTSEAGENKERMNEHARRERLVYERHLNHKNIVAFLGVATIGSAPAIVMEWYINGDIVDYIRRNPDVLRLPLITDIIEGLTYLHELTPPIVHGDLKARNVLVGEDGRAVLSDFGLARILDQIEPDVVNWGGTNRWMAPERINPLPLAGDDTHGPPTKESDVYALAGTSAEVITSKVPFQFCRYDFQVATMISRGACPYTEESFFNADIPDGAGKSKEIWGILLPFWSVDPAQRPAVTELHASLQGDALSALEEHH
ncbi:hypothetical protein JAAARDRAFT_163654 [Jaapia argillacea MUCL 33604]|uniref:Protein kinase domain-containing protein n=1 Tax=Jaapia argillacea MUCL 33604 TaxID=933084 RepID=A0A067PBV7_9AGAM|nr:hypothetical protein JAAARDRAFT_163654 [Jaapia argillacea MUCL 33604]